VVAGRWYQRGISRPRLRYLPHRRRTIVHLEEPIRSGYVFIRNDRLANVTSLEHGRWKTAHPEFCRQMGIG
jgi:hypothetical protein